ncbi:MAG: hypothetical protein DMG27_14845 [Acidobacteria bacterium]|nr:MAG: hypothetical protein DMG27_14845 [Acidobacteriota bacterium]
MEERDYRALSEQDLQELLDPSDKELRRFLKTGNGKYAVYQERLIAVCLCQGAAKHFLDQQTGVKDIDIWFFFEEHDLVRISNFRNARKSLVLALPRFATREALGLPSEGGP